MGIGIGAATLIAGTLEAGASAYGTSQAGKMKGVNPDTTNAYGEINTPNSGAINSRNSIFNSMANLQPNINAATTNAANATSSAANNPAFGAITNYGTGVMRGDYLNSPTVNNYATQAANRIQAAGADTAARTQEAFGRQGMGLGTGVTQALQTGNTAAAAQAAQQEAGIKLQNYQAERQNQMQAPGIISSGITTPTALAQQVPGQLLNPLQQQAGITNSLLGNAQASQPTLVQQPNLANDLAQGLSSGASVYSALGGGKYNQSGALDPLSGGINGFTSSGLPVTYAPGYGPGNT